MLHSIAKKLLAKRQRFLAKHRLRWYSRYQKRYDLDLDFSEAAARFPTRNALYGYAVHYFSRFCPPAVREHRAYFAQDGRGFGEDAFHSMWWQLLREFTPHRCLEIGVYRGQVISLWTLIAEMLAYPCEVHGISPFSSVGDSVSEYRSDVDYYRDTLESFGLLRLKAPILVKALSTEPDAAAHISAHDWDLVYIDGSHEYDVVLADYLFCCRHLNPGGLLVLDDASLGTAFSPPAFSFAGHPGPSRVVAEFAMKELTFLGAVGHNNVFLKPRGAV